MRQYHRKVKITMMQITSVMIATNKDWNGGMKKIYLHFPKVFLPIVHLNLKQHSKLSLPLSMSPRLFSFTTNTGNLSLNRCTQKSLCTF